MSRRGARRTSNVDAARDASKRREAADGVKQMQISSKDEVEFALHEVNGGSTDEV